MRGNGVAEFYFRQYLFACQARLLFKLNRPTEVWPLPAWDLASCNLLKRLDDDHANIGMCLNTTHLKFNWSGTQSSLRPGIHLTYIVQTHQKL